MTALVEPDEIDRDERPTPSAWRAVASIAQAELRRLGRDRTALFFLVVLPVAIIAVLGAMFGTPPERVPIGVVDLDGTERSAQLVEALEASPALEVTIADDEQALAKDVRVAGVAAGVVVPAGYAAELDAGRTIQVTMLAEQERSSTEAARTGVQSTLDEIAVPIAAASFATDEGADADEARRVADDLADEIPAVGVRTEQLGTPPDPDLSQFSYTAPANLVLFVFVNSMALAGAMAETRRYGVLRRMLATPVGRTTLLVGIGASRFGVAVIQSVLIVAIGALLFGVQWGSWPAVAALVAVFSAVGAGVGLLVGTLVRTPEQAPAVGVPLAIGMGMLGGCMWPLETVGPTMQTIGHLTPLAWAMDAWIALVFDGGGLADIATELAVLSGFAVVLLALGAWRLQRSLAR